MLVLRVKDEFEMRGRDTQKKDTLMRQLSLIIPTNYRIINDQMMFVVVVSKMLLIYFFCDTLLCKQH